MSVELQGSGIRDNGCAMNKFCIMNKFKDVRPGEKFKFLMDDDTVWTRCSADWDKCNCYCIKGHCKGTFGYVTYDTTVFLS